MKVLITGASGFVGQALINFWSTRYTLDVISRKNKAAFPTCRNAYTWDQLSTYTQQYDAIIHLAGLAHDTSNAAEEEQYFSVNRGLTKRLVDWVNKTQTGPTQLVYLSSVKTYGEEALLTEQSSQRPTSIYGRSKLAAEEYIKDKLKATFSYTILQPVMIYGEGNKGNLVRLNKLFNKLPFPFKNWKNNRSILSIDNLLAVLQALLYNNPKKNRTYIVSDDEPISTFEMLAALQSRSSSSFHFSTPRFIPKLLLKSKVAVFEKVLGDLAVSNTKLKQDLGWEKMPNETKAQLEQLKL